MSEANHNGSGRVTWAELWGTRRLLLWCLLIYVLPINMGYDLNMTGNLLAVPTFLSKFGQRTASGVLEISARDQQVLNAGSSVGLPVAGFTAGFLSDMLGRKNIIIMACVVTVIGVLVQGFATSIDMLFGGKVIGCIGFGFGHALGPVYVAEIAPPRFRGTLLSLINTMIVIGQWTCALGVYAGSFRDDDWAWRAPLFTQLIPPVFLFVVALPILPESPSWLILRGRREAAAKALRIFNGQDFDTDKAIAQIELAIQEEHDLVEQKSSYLDCFKGPNLRRTLIICTVYVAQQFIGVNFIAGYLSYYFTLAGVDNPIGIAQMAYAVQLFGNICSWPLIDRFGRRLLIVWGTIIMCATLLIIGGISTIQNDAATKATVALMTVWGFLYQATLGPAAYSVGGETASPRLRQKTYGINIISATAFSTAVLQAMPYLINPGNANLGGKITFIFFAFSVPICIYLYFCFPEMKGRTYLELEEMFQKRVPARKFATYVCVENARLEEALQQNRKTGAEHVDLDQIKATVHDTELIQHEEVV